MDTVLLAASTDIALLNTVNSQAAELRNTLILLGGVVAIIALLVAAVKSKFTLAAILMAAVVGGLMIWAMTSGQQWMSEQFDGQLSASGASAIVQTL